MGIDLDQQAVGLRRPRGRAAVGPPVRWVLLQLAGGTRHDVVDPVDLPVLEVVLMAAQDEVDAGPPVERDHVVDLRRHVVVVGAGAVGGVVAEGHPPTRGAHPAVGRRYPPADEGCRVRRGR